MKQEMVNDICEQCKGPNVYPKKKKNHMRRRFCAVCRVLRTNISNRGGNLRTWIVPPKSESKVIPTFAWDEGNVVL